MCRQVGMGQSERIFTKMGHLAVLPTVPNLQVDPSATKPAKYLCGRMCFLGTLERRH